MALKKSQVFFPPPNFSVFHRMTTQLPMNISENRFLFYPLRYSQKIENDIASKTSPSHLSYTALLLSFLIFELFRGKNNNEVAQIRQEERP